MGRLKLYAQLTSGVLLDQHYVCICYALCIQRVRTKPLAEDPACQEQLTTKYLGLPA